MKFTNLGASKDRQFQIVFSEFEYFLEECASSWLFQSCEVMYIQIFYWKVGAWKLPSQGSGSWVLLGFFFVTSASFLFFVLVIKKIDLSNLVAVTGKCLDDQGKLMQNLPLGEGKPILFWFQANKCIFVL